jgi:hypothetical protein
MTFTMTGQEKGDFNTGDIMGRFDCILTTLFQYIVTL